MTFRLTAYDTTATGKMKLKDTVDGLSANTYSLNKAIDGVYVLEGRTAYESNVPAFVFPLLDDSVRESQVFIDARSIGSYDVNKGEFRVRQQDQYTALVLQGSLALSWARGARSSIEFMSPMPMAVFMTWIAESISKRMPMNGSVQYMVTILGAILYYNNFRDKPLTDDEDSQAALLEIVTNQLKYNDSGINKMLIKEYAWISDVNDFCEACYAATQSVTLKNLNAALLYTLVGGTMWGANAAEKLCVALEYPPVWITLLFQVITDRSYRGKCALSNIALRRTYERDHQSFIQRCMIRTTEVL